MFDWDYYYDARPDVVEKGTDLATFWRDTGFKYGGQGSREFNVKYYRARYLDVQKLCTEADYDCALRHWIDHGLAAGRQGSAEFSVASYIARHSDMRRLFGTGDYVGAMEHWLADGADEGRNGAPATSEAGPVMGPVRIGGDGGSPWSDDDWCKGQYVTGWRIFAVRLTDRLQFRYPGGWAPARGGNVTFETEVLLDPGEYVVRVDYRSGGEVDNLSFHTNKGKTYGPYGGSGGNPGSYSVTPGEKLGCMQGRSADRTDQLTFSSTGPR